jgi:hypothetical protein
VPVLHLGLFLFEVAIRQTRRVLQHLILLAAAVVNVSFLMVWSALSRPSSRFPVASQTSRKPSQ